MKISDDVTFGLAGEGFISLQTIEDYDIVYSGGAPRIISHVEEAEEGCYH